LILQPDGKILVGGRFTTLGGIARNRIGRLNPDGSLDLSFNPGANGPVVTLDLQPDGKILVGGAFSELDGWLRYGIGRLYPSGSLDSSFDPGANNTVYTLGLQLDGKILVGGNFTSLGGGARNYIGRLNSDGTLDINFIDPGVNGTVGSLALQADGKILVGGNFTTVGKTTRNYIGRLSSDTATMQDLNAGSNGTMITWMRSGAGPEAWRVTYEVSTDGVIYTPLGEGVRITGGWQLTGLELPFNQNLFIRARGYYVTGSTNSSSSIVESVRNVYLRHLAFLPMVIR
jgi:uncharacterized delta-60 repeat protein